MVQLHSNDKITYASRTKDYGKLGMLSLIIFEDLCECAAVQVFSWSSRKYKRPVKSISFVETLAVSDSLDKETLLRRAFNRLLDIDIDVVFVLE